MVRHLVLRPIKVVVTGWKPGLQKIAMTTLIRDQSEFGLADSKACTDRLLDGDVVEIPMPSRSAAERLALDLTAIGAVAHAADA